MTAGKRVPRRRRRRTDAEIDAEAMGRRAEEVAPLFEEPSAPTPQRPADPTLWPILFELAAAIQAARQQTTPPGSATAALSNSVQVLQLARGPARRRAALDVAAHILRYDLDTE